jgi:hypothetical protein
MTRSEHEKKKQSGRRYAGYATDLPKFRYLLLQMLLRTNWLPRI